MSGYVRMGRGGAGNTISKEELQKKEEELRAQEYNESSNEPTPGETSPPDSLGEYKHMGRGGAGNWFVPTDHISGVISGSSEAPTPEPPTEHASSIRLWRGRGGAGNFVADVPEDSASVKKSEVEKAKVEEEKVRASVDQALQRPSQAHINDGERAFHHDLGWREAGL